MKNKNRILFSVLSLFLCLCLFFSVFGCNDEKNTEVRLKEALGGKRISILGDSISTFPGYSNNPEYNSSIGGNALWYKGDNYITDVNETWWMQTINRTGMILNVNNSWSGDTVTGRGVARALHPNSAGMELVSKCFINVLTDKYVNE